MLLNRDTLNSVPLNGRGYVPITYWPGAFTDGSYVVGENASIATDGSYVVAVRGYNPTDGSFVLVQMLSLILRVLNVDNTPVGNVPTDKTKTWAAAGVPLALEATGYIPHVTVASEDGLIIYREGVDFVLEDV